MQIMFTCLMLLWSVGGRQSERGTVLSQATSDPLLTPRRAPPSPLGSSVCCRVRKAMGLCAGFAVADFKPICGGKIGLVYRPSFIVHILFVNPTNYIFPCCRHSFLSCFLSLFAHTNAQCTQTGENKSSCYSENQIRQSTLTQSQWAIKCRPQSAHKQRGRSSQRPWSSWRKITWFKKQETIMLLHRSTHRSLFSHTHRRYMIKCPPVQRQRSGCKQATNHQWRKYGESVWLLFLGMKELRAEHNDCGCSHCNYMCFCIF